MQLTLSQWLVSANMENRDGVSDQCCLQIAASVYATSDEERVDITYGEFLNVMLVVTACLCANATQMMEAAGFRQHEALAGTLRPPQRFKHLPNGNQLLVFNPVSHSTIVTCNVLTYHSAAGPSTLTC